MTECPEMQNLQDEDLNHEPTMKDEFYNIPEELQDRMTYKEGRAYETQEERDWSKDFHKRFYGHLTTCKNPDCKTVLENHINSRFIKRNEDGTYTQVEEI